MDEEFSLEESLDPDIFEWMNIKIQNMLQLLKAMQDCKHASRRNKQRVTSLE